MAKPMTWFTGLASISSTITSVSVDVPQLLFLPQFLRRTMDYYKTSTSSKAALLPKTLK